MKKVFKKATATVTAAAMLASLTRLWRGAASSATTAAPQLTPRQRVALRLLRQQQPLALTMGDIKIGVSIWSSTDVLGSQCKLILDEAAKALGVQVQFTLTRAMYLRRLPLLLSSLLQQDARYHYL